MSILDENLLRSLTSALERAGIDTEEPVFGVPHRGGRLDCLMHISSPSGRRRLAIELLPQAYPRDVRNAAWQLESFHKDNDKARDIILMVAAEHISDGAKADLRHHGLAYFETSGTFHLRHDEWLIDIERPSKPMLRRGIVPLFTGAREQVIFALLYAHNSFQSGLALAELSKTSTYTVSTVLAELERREWIASEGSGRTLRRRVSRPAELLDAWVDAWREQKAQKTRWYFYSSNPSDLIGQLADKLRAAGTNGAIFTGSAAANLVVPHLTRTDTVDLIVPPGEAHRYAASLGLKSAEKGANVTLIERTGASTLFTNEHGLTGSRCANPFILYLDLLDGKGRNKELAAQLRQYQLKI